MKTKEFCWFLRCNFLIEARGVGVSCNFPWGITWLLGSKLFILSGIFTCGTKSESIPLGKQKSSRACKWESKLQKRKHFIKFCLNYEREFEFPNESERYSKEVSHCSLKLSKSYEFIFFIKCHTKRRVYTTRESAGQKRKRYRLKKTTYVEFSGYRNKILGFKFCLRLDFEVSYRPGWFSFMFGCGFWCWGSGWVCVWSSTPTTTNCSKRPPSRALRVSERGMSKSRNNISCLARSWASSWVVDVLNNHISVSIHPISNTSKIQKFQWQSPKFPKKKIRTIKIKSHFFIVSFKKRYLVVEFFVCVETTKFGEKREEEYENREKKKVLCFFFGTPNVLPKMTEPHLVSKNESHWHIRKSKLWNKISLRESVQNFASQNAKWDQFTFKIRFTLTIDVKKVWQRIWQFEWNPSIWILLRFLNQRTTPKQLEKKRKENNTNSMISMMTFISVLPEVHEGGRVTYWKREKYIVLCRVRCTSVQMFSTSLRTSQSRRVDVLFFGGLHDLFSFANMKTKNV